LVASYRENEDFLERRLNQFEAVDGGHGSSQVQELLRVAVGLEADFSVAGEVLCFGDFVALRKAASPSNSTMTRLRS